MIINAEDIFPKEVMEIVQQYIDGKYIYIPKKEAKRKKWGENTGVRKCLEYRNISIYDDFNNGTTKEELADKYFLSVKSIDRIILQEKRKL
ncbi:CD3324 family protein [uncultured Clostridium sp.]|uniref:CD3324 family protein n=1 Tax=uncultured Clostridium sp. TaxID=59620 RepID=UPI0028E87A24|nr:CD3324 family protein [uncultured Clostridium sp.]